MNLLKRRNKVKLTFHTRRSGYINTFPPTIGMKNVPNFWTNVTRNSNMPNISNCVGVSEFYKKAISFPLWADHEFYYDKNGIHDIVLPGVAPDFVYQYVTHHNQEQLNGAFPNAHHVKLMNPWLITADKPVPFLLCDATWNRSNTVDYFTPPGLIEFKYQTGCHINMFLNTFDRPKKVKLDAGMIIAHLIPLEDIDIEIEYKKVSQEEFNDLMPIPVSLKGNYNKIKKFVKKYTDE